MTRKYTKVGQLVEIVRERHNQGESYGEIAASYGLERRHSLSIKTSCTTMSTILHQERILIKCGSLSWMLLGDWGLIQAT